MEVLGVFDTLEGALTGMKRLQAAGVEEQAITSLSAVPYPEGVLVTTGYRPRFHWFVLACGAVGAAAGFLLAAGTAWIYPLQTGDKAIVALFPVGIITYELMMLFALVGTIVGMFSAMRLPPTKQQVYDPGIAEGRIGLLVTAVSAAAGSVAAAALREAGAVRVLEEEQ
jgi:Alternative complex III, ActD subunit